VLLTALALASQSAAAQEAVLSVHTDARGVVASVALRQAPTERVLAALGDGLTSEIVFELRLYRRQEGFFAWLGDRPLATARVSRVGSFDPYTGRYVVYQDGRTEASFVDQADFVRYFFLLSDYGLGGGQSGDSGRLYVLARVRLSPVRLIGPLNIVTLFSSDNLVTTDWVEQGAEYP
jgi:hypothetical protein